MKILIVDDEKDIVDLVAYNLEKEGHEVLKAYDGERAIQSIRSKGPDLVILDLMLPGIQGLEVCKRLRQDPSTAVIPIIMLTAKGDEIDKVLGLEVGVDDYITKPFSLKELMARVKALLRRADVRKAPDKAETFEFKGLRIDLKSYEVTVNGRNVNLSPTEFKLLRFLSRNPGRVYSRDQILDRVWGDESYVEPRTVDVHIRRLRAQIEPDENSPNSQVSYYRKGAMVALALDLEVRLRTQGRISLDDIMRVLSRTHGDAGHGLAEGVFEEIAAETSGLDLGDFFRTALRTTQDPPVGILLAQFGVRLNMRRATGHGDAGGTAGAPDEAARAWLGIRIRSDHGRVIVKHVLDDGPAQRAGLVPNDELVAIAGRRIGTASLAEVTRRLRTDQPVEMYLLRREELLRVYVTPAEAPRDTCYLTLDQQATGDALSRRQQWLGFSGG